MSYVDFKNAMEMLEKNKSKIDVQPPCIERDIIRAEQQLNIIFPNSYKQVLKKYGYLEIGGEEIFGLYNDTIIRNAFFYRETNKDLLFSSYFIPVYALGNGEIFCLDTARMDNGECPVVAWYFGAVEKIAEDFGQFLLKQVIDGLTFLKECEK